MKNIVAVFAIALCMFGISNAFSKTSSKDAFRVCMDRTKQDRLSCQAGCGMIVQQCYAEGVADINEKIKRLMLEVKSKNGDACANFAALYLEDASRMDGDISDKADGLPGWVGSEMKLNFAKQRLDNLGLIRESCKQ
jgi:hypothetical protein